MTVLMPGVSEDFLGIMHSVASLGTVLTAFFAGYCANYLADTKCVLYIAIAASKQQDYFACFKMADGIWKSDGDRFVYRLYNA